MTRKLIVLCGILCLSLSDFGAGAEVQDDAKKPNPWDPGVEKPSAEALASPLFIKPVQRATKSRITFTVTEQAGVERKRSPIRGALPFRRGELTDPEQVRLLDRDGKEIPVQTLVTAYWPEKSIRWLCLDFLTDIGAKKSKTFTLEFGSEVKGLKKSALKVTQEEGVIQIDTGRMKLSFARGEQFSGQVIRGKGGTSGPIVGKMVLSKGSEAADPTSLPLIVDEARLSECGPVQATVYLRGGYGTEKVKDGIYKFPFHGHVRIYGDTCRMEVVHSFGYNGDENTEFVRRYGLIVPTLAKKGGAFIYGGDEGAPSRADLKSSLSLVQGRHDAWQLSGDQSAKGRRFGGWAALENPTGHTTIGLRNAWQQWPVTLEAHADGRLALFIYGASKGEFLDLRYLGDRFGKSKSMYVGPKLSNTYSGDCKGRAMGLLKISELVLDFEADPNDAGRGVHLPLVPYAGSKRISEAKGIGHTGTYEGAKEAVSNVDAVKRWADALLDFPVIQHEANGYYGWVDWPDQGDCNPPKNGRFNMIMQGGIGWTNSERALPSYYFHYAAGGHEKYLHLGHAYALHTIGIDLEHPGGEMSPGTAHRHNQVHWRSGGGPRQCGMRGWIIDAWMTGHPEIRRILFDVYLPRYRPKPGNGPDKVMVCMKGGAYNYAVLQAYLMTLDPVWVKHHKAIDAAVYEAASKGMALPYSPSRGGTMTWKNGKIALKNIKPGQIAGYWLTYGADDRLVEHASLFGYDVSLKAVRAWGDSYFGPGKKPPKIRRYHSPEAGFAGYFLLTRNPRALSGLKNRFGGRRIKGQPIEWDAYNVKGTAEQWHKLIGQGYGKNGFKIAAADVYETVYALAAFEHAKKSAPPAKPKTSERPGKRKRNNGAPVRKQVR